MEKIKATILKSFSCFIVDFGTDFFRLFGMFSIIISQDIPIVKLIFVLSYLADKCQKFTSGSINHRCGLYQITIKILMKFYIESKNIKINKVSKNERGSIGQNTEFVRRTINKTTELHIAARLSAFIINSLFLYLPANSSCSCKSGNCKHRDN